MNLLPVQPAESSPSARSAAAGLGLIFALALTLRLVCLIWWRQAESFGLYLGDALSYHRWALQLADGDWLGQQTFYQAPLYPYFLGVIYTLLGAGMFTALSAQAIVGALSCVLLAWAGWRMFGKSVGLLAGVLLAVYPPAIYFDLSLQKTVLDGFLLALALSMIASLLRSPATWRWLMLGASLGLLTLTRENAAVFLPIMIVVALLLFRDHPLLTRLGWAGSLILGTALVLLPVGLRNQAVGGEFLLTTSQFGPNFYIGNHEGATGVYEPLSWGRGDPRYERDDATTLAQRAMGRELTPSEVSHYWTCQALAFIRQHPLQWYSLLGRKVLLTINAREVGDSDDLYTFGDDCPPARWISWAWNWGVLLPLAAAGGVLCWNHRGTRVLLAMLLAYAAGVCLFFVFGRYRFPLTPMLMLLAAAALVQIVQACRSPQQRRSPAQPGRIILAATMAGIAALIAHMPLVQLKPMKAVTQMNVGSAFWQQRHDVQQAIEHYQQAIELDPGYAVAYYNLGAALAQQQRWSEALAAFEEAIRLKPDATAAWQGAGNALMELGRFEDALTCFHEALDYDSTDPLLHSHLARLFTRTGQLELALAHLEQAVQLDADSAEAHNNLANGLARLGRFAPALAAWQRALELDPALADARFNYARALAQVGQREQAIAQLEQLRRDRPDDAGALRLLEQLQSTTSAPLGE